MLDNNATTFVKWSGSNIKHYRKLGYVFTKQGDSFEVNVSHLTSGSRSIVPILCDICGDFAFSKEYKTYMKLSKNHKDICDKCKIKNPELCTKNDKVPFKLIQNSFEEKGLNLITTEENYVNTNTTLFFICNKHIDIGEQNTKWSSFRNSKFGCKKCARDSMENFMKNEYDYSQRKVTWEYNIELAKREFENRGFLLLTEEYKYNYTNMDYLCLKHSNKGVQQTSLKTVMNKEKFPNVCKWCSIEDQRGSNSHFWKGGATDKNKLIRESYEGNFWRKSVFKRDNYICQCCGDDKGGNLQAHHIENFRDNEDLRFDIENGITLCKNCHDPSVKGSFHYVYGTLENTKEQLEEYFKLKKSSSIPKKYKRRGSRSFFTNNQVLDIKRKLNNKIKPKDIAKEYGVNISVIYSISSGRNYKHVEENTN